MAPGAAGPQDGRARDTLDPPEMDMTIIRRIAIALVAASALATGSAQSASTTNFSDQWWVEAESGWGASVLQQADVLFIDLFVYSADARPTWFTVAASQQGSAPAGHTVFTGDLYQTSGPYYGGPFNASAVTYAKVGTLTFDADSAHSATLTYTVNGVAVTKIVSRQLWRYENLGGSYYGGMLGEQVACNPASENGTFEFPAAIQVVHNPDNSVRVDIQSLTTGVTYQLEGTYSQSGHMGRIAANFVPAGVGSVVIDEIEKSISGFTARLSGSVQSPAGACQIVNGRIGGVQR